MKCIMADYRYRQFVNPKSDLRLLQIQPGQQDENFECTLQTYSFNSQLFGEVLYDALSYTWGDATSRTPISINGRRFSVTPNLEAVLRDLRVPKTKENRRQLRFWIDAICIYFHRYQTKYCGNLRFGPLFSRGFRFTSREQRKRHYSSSSG
jgi:hypothetical protein